MRVRNYDEHIPEASAAVTRWHERSKRRGIDMENEEALSALAQVRRAANVAGRRDRKRVKAWDDSYRALQALSAQIRYAPDGKGSWSMENSKEIAAQAEQHTSTVVDSSPTLGSNLDVARAVRNGFLGKMRWRKRSLTCVG